MHVVFVHDKVLPVLNYGGTERVLFALLKHLRLQKHSVTLIGHTKSQVEHLGIDLIPYQKESWQHQIPKDADIVHLHFPYIDELCKPLIVTIHGNGKPGERFHKNTVFVSKSHAQNHGSERFVYNGLDFNEYCSRNNSDQNSWKNFLFLANAKWKVKNLKDCIRASKKAKKHLHVAGGSAWSLSKWIHSYGLVDQNQKLNLLAQTDALLWPTRWPEPFGLAVIEAMFMGKPVIASKHGASPELINKDVGVICNDFEEFLRAIIDRPINFSCDKIRSYAQETFNAQRMTQKYINLYEMVLSGHTLNDREPTSGFHKDAQTLLPF